MSDPFVAEIRIFAGNFPPRGWAMCNGQLMPIAQNTALFSLLGTTYGGDGRFTFALPNLQQRAPLHPGQGPGLSERLLGEMGGEAYHTLNTAELPSHRHAPQASGAPAASGAANGGLLAKTTCPSPPYHDAAALQPMAPGVIGSTGGNAAHNNLQPYLKLNFIIALWGIYPPRS
ncbi:phage tail protein [Rugamonas apoptosis]|uniref:Phage tail protein n=1 Tax=Rugamonas apoptosis TaxID=2758570 RepID=A0A7W2F5H2_9BURK|nr:tail fiber protein [Rugamonas apoptosis]MBA5685481.1 phage tail protein [Rugamonas apoptosis]